MMGVWRKVDWSSDPNKDSMLFHNFSKELEKKMAKEELVIHGHDWAILEKEFKTHPSLGKAMHLL